MLPMEAGLRVGATLVAATFALLLAPAGRASRAARFLALFFALLALNQGAETARALAAPGDDAAAWATLARVAASLDPFALAAAVLALAGPDGTRAATRRWALRGVATASVGLALASVALEPAPGSALLLGAFTATVYVGLLVWTLDRALDAPDRAPWLRLVQALAFLAVPTSVGIVDNAVAWLGADVDPAQALTLQVAGAALVALAVSAVVLERARRSGASPRVRRGVARAVAGSLLILALLKSADLDTLLHQMLGLPFVPDLVVVGRTGAATRSFLFGALASTALFAHDAVGLSLRARRRAARVLVALAFGLVLLGGATVAAVAFGAPPLNAFDLLVMAGVLLLSQGFRDLIDATASRVYGVPRRALDAPAEPLREGMRVAGRYDVERLLAEGGEGRVFLARDALLDRRVVLKEVRDRGGEGEGLREARLAGRIDDPRIVTVHDAFQHAGRWVLVLDHVDGGTLEERLAEGSLALTERVRLLLDVVEGVAAAHGRGIVHGDIKPRNILVTRDLRARVADFGLARLAEGDTRPIVVGSPVLATPDHLAPERWRGAPATLRADVYALGVVARALLGNACPPDLAAAIARAVARAPEDRYPSAIEMRDAIRSSTAGSFVPP